MLLPLITLAPLYAVKSTVGDDVKVILSAGFVLCCFGIFNLLAGPKFESRLGWLVGFFIGAALDVALYWLGLGYTVFTVFSAGAVYRERRRQENERLRAKPKLVCPTGKSLE